MSSHDVASNTTCPIHVKPEDPIKLWQDGQLNFSAHVVGWIISGFFTLIAVSVSMYLIFKHLSHYTMPSQQRHIVRMLFAPVVYAIVSWAAYIMYRQAIYYQTIRDCYEAVALTSFMFLVLSYVGDTPAEVDEVFRQVKLKKWAWPLGWWKYRPSGLHFLYLMRISILQYAVVRPLCTLAAVGLQYMNLYCLASWSPRFGHLYISVTVGVSVTVALYAIVQIYLPIATQLKPYSPVLKFLAIKAIVFILFWQESFLSLLATYKVIKETTYMTAEEVVVGIGALALCFEMVLFAFLHVKAFPWSIYRPADRKRTTSRWAAFVDVIDFRDWYHGMRDSSKYVVSRARGREFNTAVDAIRRQKYEVLEQAMGRERWDHFTRETERQKEATAKSFWKDEAMTDEDGLKASASDVDIEKSVAGTALLHDAATSKARRAASTRADATLDPEGTLNRPNGNRALRADFDPEKAHRGRLDEDDDDDDDDEEAGDVQAAESRGLMMSLAGGPTLPALRYDHRTDPHPELSQFHAQGNEEATAKRAASRKQAPSTRARLEDKELHGMWHETGSNTGESAIARWRDVSTVAAVPLRRQGSGSLGAWWRSVRERISGSEAAVEESDERAQETEHILQGVDKEDAKEMQSTPQHAVLTARPKTQAHGSNSSADSKAADSVLKSADSPLAAFIASHRTSSPEALPATAASTNAQDVDASQAAAARPPLLQSFTASRSADLLSTEAGATSGAVSRVSSMRTDLAHDKPKDVFAGPPVLLPVAGAAQPVPVAAAVDAKSELGSVSSAGGPNAAVASPSPHKAFSDVASSLPDVPRGTLFSDPTSERYAARAATRPPVRDGRGNAAPSARKAPAVGAAPAGRQVKPAAQASAANQSAVLAPADFAKRTASPAPPMQTLANQAPQSQKPRASTAVVKPRQSAPQQQQQTPSLHRPIAVRSTSGPVSTHTAAAAPLPNAYAQPPPPLAAPTRAPSVLSQQSANSGGSIAPGAAALSSAGPKGKKINLKLPTPLSPESFPYGAEGEAPIVATPPAAVDAAPAKASRISFADQAPTVRSKAASKAATSVASQPLSAEEAERAYLGLPAPRGSKGTVTNGPQSQAQLKAIEEAAARAREDAERVKRFEAWRAEKVKADAAARQAVEVEARRAAEARRTATAPPPPRPSDIVAVVPPVEMKWTWLGKKPRQPAPYTPLPAPSQLGNDVGDVKDAFSAGAEAREVERTLEDEKVGSHIKPGMGAGSRFAQPLHPNFGGAPAAPAQTWSQNAPRPYPNAPGMPPATHAMPGSVAHAQAYPRAPGMPRPHAIASGSASYGPAQMHAQSAQYPYAAAPRAYEAPRQSRHSGPPPPPPGYGRPSHQQAQQPGNAVGSSTSRPATRPRASYDAYTGEPYAARPASGSRQYPHPHAQPHSQGRAAAPNVGSRSRPRANSQPPAPGGVPDGFGSFQRAPPQQQQQQRQQGGAKPRAPDSFGHFEYLD